MAVLALSDMREADPPRGRAPAGGACALVTAGALAAAEWDELAARAGPSLLTRHVLCAHAAHGFAPDLGVLSARRDGRLVGTLPVRPRGAWFGLGRRIGTAWGSPYVPSSDPLVDSGEAEAAASALLDGLARLGPLWILPRLTLGSSFATALRAELVHRGQASAVLDSFARPVTPRHPDWAAHLAATGARRAKDMRRRARRIGALGTVSLRSGAEAGSLARDVETFLRLESAGWKGRRGSAMASRGVTAGLARALFGAAEGPVRGRSDVLLLDGRPVAASLALVHGGTAFMLKSAYDETLARAAPGIVLEQEILRACHERPFADRLDSVAGADTHLAALYPGRAEVGDLVLATGRDVTPAALGRDVAAELLRRRWIAAAKLRWRALGGRRP